MPSLKVCSWCLLPCCVLGNPSTKHGRRVAAPSSSTLLWHRLNPASRAFAVEEVHLDRPQVILDRPQVILNRLVGIVAVHLIVAEHRYRNPLDARVAHALEQVPVMLPNTPAKKRQSVPLRSQHFPIHG